MLIKNHNLKIIYSITLLFLFCSSSYSSNIQKDLIALENYLNSIKNMSFIFEQKDKKNCELLEKNLSKSNLRKCLTMINLH